MGNCVAIDPGCGADRDGPIDHLAPDMVRSAEHHAPGRWARSHRAVRQVARSRRAKRAWSTAILGAISAGWGAGLTTYFLIAFGVIH